MSFDPRVSHTIGEFGYRGQWNETPANTWCVFSLWLQKLVLLDLYRRLLLDLSYEKYIIRGYMLVFFATYVAVQVITFTECRPFRLYWQVVPDPGMTSRSLLVPYSQCCYCLAVSGSLKGKSLTSPQVLARKHQFNFSPLESSTSSPTLCFLSCLYPLLRL